MAYRRRSNYIFILNLTHGFIRLDKNNCKTKRETFKFENLVRLVRLILENLRYLQQYLSLNVGWMESSFALIKKL